MAEKSDVIVIGGGIIGCSLTYELSRKGLSVVLLEKGLVGSEASGRNGGGVRQQNRDPAELPLAMTSVEIWSKMKKDLQADVEYRQTGNLRLVRASEDIENFRKSVEQQNKMGLNVQLLSADETRNLVPALSKGLDLVGATYCATDGTANPLLVTKAIAKAARALGARIYEREPVTAFEMDSGKILAVTTPKDRYHASVFVNVAGPWAKSICNWIGLDYPITIKRSQILVTEPLPPIIREFISADVGYMRQALNGGIHLGIRSLPVEQFDKSTSTEAFREAGKGYLQLFPSLKNVNVIHSWAGLTNWTLDSLPIIDRGLKQKNFFLAAGFSGHGFCLGPAVGKLLAEWITEGSPSLDLKPFRWSRFDTA